ncbi:signal recognition particle subunit [Kappamyces sp. JEL0829]|nr:signal recognition particle subunit [Kappamyces sp. JEL0829]
MSDDDIDNMDFDLPAELVESAPAAAPPAASAPANPFASLMGGGQLPPGLMEQKMIYQPPTLTPEEELHCKDWLCIYPCYINKKRTKDQGRKVGVEYAIDSPSAIYMAEAATRLGLEVLLEPQKRHPKDALSWGRLRIKRNHRVFNSKTELLVKIAAGFVEAKHGIVDDDGKIETYSNHSISVLSPRPKPPAAATSAPAPLSVTASAASEEAAPVPKAQPSKSAQKKKKEKRKIVRM